MQEATAEHAWCIS